VSARSRGAALAARGPGGPLPAPGARPGGPGIWGALIVVYLVWGSTYLGIRVVVGLVPPLIAMGTRFVAAAVVLAIILVARHGPGVLRVPPRRALAAALAGVLLLAGGNGAVAVAEQVVPSGLAALVVAAVPLWLVCLRLLTGDRLRAATLAGTALGFVGIAVLALPGSHPAGTPRWGMAVIICGSLSWAIGSFASQRLPVPGQPFVATTYEMLAAGLAMLAAGTVSGEAGRVQLAAIPPRGWLALAYLAVIGSVAAFSAYVWLLGNAPLSLTATYAYVNPVVAVALGALILSEPVTWPILLGGAIVLAGVALVVSVERPGAPPGPRSRRA
jgi:drug/metabolite transporter (DMT)-like permease